MNEIEYRLIDIEFILECLKREGQIYDFSRYDNNNVIRFRIEKLTDENYKKTLMESEYLKNVLQKVCDVLDLNQDAVISKSRKRELVGARQYYFLITEIDRLAEIHSYSLTKVASLVSRTHATILSYKREYLNKELKYIDKKMCQYWDSFYTKYKQL